MPFSFVATTRTSLAQSNLPSDAQAPPQANSFDFNRLGFVRPIPPPAQTAPPTHKTAQSRTTAANQHTGHSTSTYPYTSTPNDRRTIPRASSSPPNSPAPIAWISTFPIAVASLGPADAEVARASA